MPVLEDGLREFVRPPAQSHDEMGRAKEAAVDE